MSDVNTRLATALAGRYAIDRELGYGGMATVHLARELKHGRVVAIKVLRPELAQAVGADRFLREISIAANLQSPYILPLLESGEADGLLYYVMPFVEGESLRSRLAAQGALAPSETMRLLRDIVDGLAHAHRHGVVHRDMKPDNVMIAERHALVVDFGVAKAMSNATDHHDLTSIGISLGTPAYMAPEQALADPRIDHRADIYAVGVIAYEMLAGKPPFSGPPQAVLSAHITSEPPPLVTVRPDVPPAIAAIVAKCLEKDPDARFQTADDLLQAIESLTTPGSSGVTEPVRRRGALRRWALPATGVLILGIAAFFATGQVRRQRWVHQTAIPELRRMIEAGEADSAFNLAMRIEKAAPGDSTLETLWPRFTRKTVVKSTPDGATVYRASLPDTSEWNLVGTTPTDSIRLPVRPGMFRYEKPGFRAAYHVFTTALPVLLDSVDAPLPEMIRIAGGRTRAFLVGSDGAEPLQLADYRLDRYEITNRQYKAFVDAGGYRNRAYWEHPIREGSRTLSWEEVSRRFVDRTGRPGPSTWEGGDFPAGQGDMPVGGVSWYEAAAYATYAGKSLPTIYHWARAAGIQFARFVVPESNLEGRGPLPVGRPRGISIAGVSDLAGNVREWCVNEAGRNQRFILGGGWSDPTYAFVDAYAQDPMDRSPINGIRLALYDAADANLARASGPIPRAFTDYTLEKPVTDAVYAGFLQLFDYDPAPLDARVELRDSTSEDWIAERVSFSAAYGGERMPAWIFFPRQGSPPFQTIVFFPGSGAINAARSTNTLDARVSFFLKSGRAVVLPIYKSTFERADSLTSDIPTRSIFWRDHVVMWVKDYRRTLDYLSTRPEFDTTKFAYYGLSWGGNMGGIIPAVEPRIKTSILYVAGFTMERSRPEVDPLHYLPRIRTPVLMLNGRHDFFFPTETAQKPFFELIGSPPADKKYIVYEGGHDVPRTQLIAESLAWLDKYLGPVR